MRSTTFPWEIRVEDEVLSRLLDDLCSRFGGTKSETWVGTQDGKKGKKFALFWVCSRCSLQTIPITSCRAQDGLQDVIGMVWNEDREHTQKRANFFDFFTFHSNWNRPQNFPFTSNLKPNPLTTTPTQQRSTKTLNKTSSSALGFHCKVVDLGEIYNFPLGTYPWGWSFVYEITESLSRIILISKIHIKGEAIYIWKDWPKHPTRSYTHTHVAPGTL